MITISDSLSAASVAKSRSPALRVTVNSGSIPEPTVLSSASIPYTLRRFQMGNNPSNKYYIITAFDSSTYKIYYKRTTSISSASDWESGYTELVTTDSEWSAYGHDMFINWDDVIIVYQKSPGVIKARESSNGGQSFGSEYTLVDLSGYPYTESRAYEISIANMLTVFVRTAWVGIGHDGLYRVCRTGVPGDPVWESPERWDCGWFFAKGSAAWTFINSGIHARETGTLTHIFRVLGQWQKGSIMYDSFEWPHIIDNTYGSWGVLDATFGRFARDSEYTWHVTGLTRKFNGYYFASIHERYYTAYDASGGDIGYDFFLARTTDLKSYTNIPFTRRSYTSSQNATWVICGIALTEDDSNICIPMWERDDNLDYSSVVYILDKSAWFGEETAEEDLTGSVLNDVSINSTFNRATTTSLSLSCAKGSYENSAIIEPGATVKISAGYNINGTKELQQRFTGVVQNYSKAINTTKVLNVNVMDNLYLATSRKQRDVHVLEGQNVFHAGMDEDTDVDLFVQQSGVFAVDSGDLVVDTRNTHIAIAGYDPTDAAMIVAKFKVTGSTTSVFPGIIFYGNTYDDDSWAGGVSAYKAILWNAASGAFSYYEWTIDSEGVWSGISRQTTSPLQVMSLDTYYWLMVKVKHGQLDVWYSTDGANWISCLSDLDVNGGLSYPDTPSFHSNEGYVGICAGIYTDAEVSVRFDSLTIFSLYHPQSGSDIMKYLAGLSNMGTNERMEVDDSFVGPSWTDIWDTPGVDGTWTHGTGTVSGYKSVSAAMIKCSTSAANIIVKADGLYDTDLMGIFARGNEDLTQCYALLVDELYVRIMKKDTTWTTLMKMPWTPPAYIGPGAATFVKLKLCCNGPFISGFINEDLRVFAYDTDFSSGYCGMVAAGTVGDPSIFSSFSIDGFYSPVDVATIKPGDTVASVMGQVASMYYDGGFFCDVNGDLRWGTFSSTTADVDERSVIKAIETQKATDSVLSFIRAVGDNAYGEVKDRVWGSALLGYAYDSIEDKSIKTRSACNELAIKALAESQKLTMNSVQVIGNPAIELGDVVGISETISGEVQLRRVLSISESIGSVYEMGLSDLKTQVEETP